MDSLVDFGLVEPERILPARDAQTQITALLITTIRSLESDLAARKAASPRTSRRIHPP